MRFALFDIHDSDSKIMGWMAQTLSFCDEKFSKQFYHDIVNLIFERKPWDDGSNYHGEAYGPNYKIALYQSNRVEFDLAKGNDLQGEYFVMLRASFIGIFVLR